MDKKRIVVALGRNSFGETFPEQQENVKKAAAAIADLIEAKYQVVITHSNGPQIGMIHTAMNEFCKLYPEYTATPMSVCSAMSQGYIGYDLQNAIREELINRGIYKTVSTIITQVRVDPFDIAFSEPSKVIGRYMSKEEADAEEEKGNALVKETFPLLKECPDINFIGSVEARDIPYGAADVIVCEAFAGNIILKLYEGVAGALLKKVKKGMLSSLRSKIGALLVKPALKGVLKDFDTSEYGGAPLLGLNGLVVKTHGSSKSKEVCNSIIQCVAFKEQKINEKIKEAIQQETLEEKKEEKEVE